MSQLTLLATGEPLPAQATTPSTKMPADAGSGSGDAAIRTGSEVQWENSDPSSGAPPRAASRSDKGFADQKDGSGSGAATTAETTASGPTHLLADPLAGLATGYWIIIALSLTLSGVAIYFWNLSDKAEANLRASERELEEVKRAFKKATIAQSNAASTLTRGGVASAPAAAPAPQFKTPVEVERAVARLSTSLAGKLNIVNEVYRILQPHAAVVGRIPELDSRLQAAKKVLDSKDSPDKAAAAILAAEALLAAPELASEGLLRELLQDTLRAQRRKGSVTLEESRALAAALAAACATDLFVPEVGQPFDKNLHQAVGDSATSAFREPTIKRVVSGGLREPKTGHIGIRADVEIG